MNVVIVKYSAGNTRSVQFALEKCGANVTISDDIDIISSADRVILPGVGHAASAMLSLKERKLDLLLPKLKQPLLGICLGMQLMCTYSEEGEVNCLGIFPQKVQRFPASSGKIPQVGWNALFGMHDPVFNNVVENDMVYFVHSYYVAENANTIAKTNYGINYSAAMRKNNFTGMQFHPEKSASVGMKLLTNFLSQH